MSTTTELDALRAEAEQAGRDLEGAHPSEILRWAADRFGTDLVLASSMGDEVLVDLAAKAAPGIAVIFLDTGYHFAETIGTRDYYAEFTDISLLVTSDGDLPLDDHVSRVAIA